MDRSRRRKVAAVLASTAIVAMSHSFAYGGARTEVAGYQGGGSHDLGRFDFTGCVYDYEPLDCDDGYVFFKLNGNEVGIDIVIQDQFGWPVGALYSFGESEIPTGQFCGSVFGLEIPPLAGPYLTIYIDGPAFGPIDCALSGVVSPGWGTKGTVVATLHSVD